jgi:hypothetical protein
MILVEKSEGLTKRFNFSKGKSGAFIRPSIRT